MEQYSRDFSFEEYKLSVLSKYPKYSVFLDEIEKANIADDMLTSAIEDLVDRQKAHQLALTAIDVSEGRKDKSVLLDQFGNFEYREKIQDVDFVTDDLEVLYNETVLQSGLRWRLNTLNRMLGSLRKGDFGFLFARPETGKTTFLASEVTHMASQTERPILWFNNEEQGNKVKLRCYQAALGVDLVTLYSNRGDHSDEYHRLTGGRIKIVDRGDLHKRFIENLCKQLEPSLIIFDQIDKIKGFDSDREDLRLGSIYIWARELAKKYAPVIGVCQADVTGEGKKYLDMGNVANAKTSKQAEADWILGIGAIHDIGYEHIRYLHLSKNKLFGDADTDSNLRHGKTEVSIKPQIARYSELGE